MNRYRIFIESNNPDHPFRILATVISSTEQSAINKLCELFQYPDLKIGRKVTVYNLGPSLHNFEFIESYLSDELY